MRFVFIRISELKLKPQPPLTLLRKYSQAIISSTFVELPMKSRLARCLYLCTHVYGSQVCLNRLFPLPETDGFCFFFGS